MDKSVEFTMLYEIYGKLLTKKQQEIFEEYYLYNLSLREIAENKKKNETFLKTGINHFPSYAL